MEVPSPRPGAALALRTLAREEREACLALLDHWEIGDGWRGRDFFRRYFEHEPGFRDANVHVAVEAGEIVACVQVFPRRIRIAGAIVPCGGIGSVFTHPAVRQRGLGAALLERSHAAMREAGLELALLFAGPVAWYRRLGWRSLRRAYAALARASRPPPAPPGVETARFERARDLDALRALHAAATVAREGALVRDAAHWEASLRVAGNPEEEIRVARRDGELVAYLRCCVLGGTFVATEALHAPGAAGALVALLADALRPCAPDLLAQRAGVQGDVRTRVLLDAPALDPEFTTALREHDARLTTFEDEGTMLRVLDAEALARRLGCEPPGPGEQATEWLVRRLDPARFGFLSADRF